MSYKAPGLANVPRPQSAYAGAVLLRHPDGRKHHVAVVTRATSPEAALGVCIAVALRTVSTSPGWEVEDYHLFDQHVIDMEFHP